MPVLTIYYQVIFCGKISIVNNYKRVGLIITTVLIIAALVIFFILRQQQSPEVSTPSESTATSMAAPQVWDDLYISSHILQWLENDMRDERGAYNMLFNCNNDDSGELVCNNGSSSNRTGTPVIWANYMYWKNTGDTAAFERMGNALAVYSDRKIIEIIQTDNLSCFYMLPIINDTALSKTMREQAASICMNTAYETAIQIEPFWDSISADYYKNQTDQLITNIISGAETLEFDFALPEPTGTVIPRNRWFEFAADSMAINQLIGYSLAHINMAYFHFAGALTIYYQDNDNLNFSCRLLLASQQFCEFTGDTSDLSCLLASHLTDKVTANMADADFNIEGISRCALASPVLKDRALSLMKDYYYSEQNSNFQPFDNFWLLTERGSITKSVVSNALFAGFLSF